jgi:hypothetical protein
MFTFSELVASRREWIDDILKPWCRQATRKDLLLAETEWQDLAGRAAPGTTLWLWAWSRFPDLCSEGLQTLDETRPVVVTCRDGRTIRGYPDARQSQRGQLVLVAEAGQTLDPLSIDDVLSVHDA